MQVQLRHSCCEADDQAYLHKAKGCRSISSIEYVSDGDILAQRKFVANLNGNLGMNKRWNLQITRVSEQCRTKTQNIAEKDTDVESRAPTFKSCDY